MDGFVYQLVIGSVLLISLNISRQISADKTKQLCILIGRHSKLTTTCSNYMKNTQFFGALYSLSVTREPVVHVTQFSSALHGGLRKMYCLHILNTEISDI